MDKCTRKMIINTVLLLSHSFTQQLLGPVQELTNKCEGGALRLLEDHLTVAHHQPVVNLSSGKTHRKLSSTCSSRRS